MTLFNHTSTFKQQSSYPISTQYINSAKYLLKPLAYTTAEKDAMKKELDLASVAYIQSGCNPPSDRDVYVQELMKHIRVDSYGKCLHNKDLPQVLRDPMTMFDKVYLEFFSKYKFIVSFENARCDDYMTEKIFRTMHMGVVPVYMGASNIREWLPSTNAVVLADDFKTPKELAEYIRYLDENPKEYEKLLKYKSTGITNDKLKRELENREWGVDTIRKMNYITGFECHVCDQIHRNRKLVKDGKEPIQHVATVEHYGCPKPVMFQFPKIANSENYERQAWGWEYDQAKENAWNLRKKVLGTLLGN